MPWGDDRILREILRRGRMDFSDPRVRRIFNRAAVETGLVESGGRNLRYGDADSLGWRQERSSLYPNPLNVRASVRRFAREFGQFYDPGETAGQVAAQIQRPAAQFRGRYQAMLPEAKRVLAQAGAGGLGRGGAGGGQQAAAVQALLGASGVSSLPGGSGGTLALLQALQGAQGASQAPSGGGLQAPAFSAAPTLPQGAQPIASSGGPQPKQDIGALLQAVQTVGAGMPSAGVPDAASALRGGVEGAPAQVKSGAVGKLKAAAERIDDARVPYLWGGGHQGKQNRWGPVTPLDCSGAVSRALGINPLVSGQFAKWGKAGRGNRVTIYANNEHVLMEIDGRFWGTSQANPRGGAGWIPRKFISKDYLSRFAVRHPPGM